MKKNDSGATIITICSPKGGVGRTTMAVALAAALARRGERALVLDLDAAGHATRWLLGDEGDHGAALMGALQGPGPLTCRAGAHGVDVVAGGVRSRGALSLMDTILGRARFERALEPVRQACDVVLIDTPPIGVERVLPALTVSHACVVPVQPCVYSILAAQTVAARLEGVRAEGIKLPTALGCVVSRALADSALTDQALAMIEDDPRLRLIRPVIPDHDAFPASMERAAPGLLLGDEHEDIGDLLTLLSHRLDDLTGGLPGTDHARP